jgi:uncharacterized membrane protein YgcG
MPPAAVKAPPLPQGPALVTLSFKDVSVAELVALIAEQGNVGIVINDDVNAKLKHINLIEKTPEEAIQFVAQAANLEWRKLDNKTYIIAKNLPPLTSEQQNSITPERVNSVPGNSLWPSAGALGSSGLDANGIPRLVDPTRDNTPARDPKRYAYVRIRNVTPRLIAYWLDPANNPKPLELQQAEGNFNDNIIGNKYPAKSAVDPAELQNMYGDGTSSMNVAANNPYAQGNSYGRGAGAYGQFPNPYMFSNPQFGGGFGGGGGGQFGGGQFGGGQFGGGGGQVGGQVGIGGQGGVGGVGGVWNGRRLARTGSLDRLPG